MTTAHWQDRWQRVMLNNYGTPPVALMSGNGMRVTDADGKEYLDFLAGIAVNALGHAHPAIADAISKQARELVHVSNLAIHPKAVELAEKLVQLSGWDARVFFCQDGATANEAALKIARRYGYSLRPDGTKQRIVAMHNAFHGRSMGALAVTGNPAKREPFAPFGHDVTFVDFGDASALRAAMGDDVVAIITEPTQGEGGMIVPPPEFLAATRAIADEFGALLIVDEVQSGIGRTGHWFASSAAGVRPDILTLAKGLAGGLPLGAVLATGPATSALQPGDHGTTFGGNPISCAAALAVIDTIEREGLLVHVQAMTQRLLDGLHGIASPRIAEVRANGLWFGIQLAAPIAGAIESALRNRGFIVNAVKPDVVRLAPPFIVQPSDIEQFLRAFAQVLDEVS